MANSHALSTLLPPAQDNSDVDSGTYVVLQRSNSQAGASCVCDESSVVMDRMTISKGGR